MSFPEDIVHHFDSLLPVAKIIIGRIVKNPAWFQADIIDCFLSALVCRYRHYVQTGLISIKIRQWNIYCCSSTLFSMFIFAFFMANYVFFSSVHSVLIHKSVNQSSHSEVVRREIRRSLTKQMYHVGQFCWLFKCRATRKMIENCLDCIPGLFAALPPAEEAKLRSDAGVRVHFDAYYIWLTDFQLRTLSLGATV